MEKELPPSDNGQSAFTVFGFGQHHHYANFDTPLETAANVESFNATNSIAFPSRPTQKSKKQFSSTDADGEGECFIHFLYQLMSSNIILDIIQIFTYESKFYNDM